MRKEFTQCVICKEYQERDNCILAVINEGELEGRRMCCENMKKDLKIKNYRGKNMII